MSPGKKNSLVRPIVLVVSHAGETREYEFSHDSIVIGNGPTANVLIEDERVSTIHAIIKVTIETATLIDLGSESGTRVGGKPVREKTLEDGDEIEIGGARIGVQLPPLAGAVVERKPEKKPEPMTFEKTAPGVDEEVVSDTVELKNSDVHTVIADVPQEPEKKKPAPKPAPIKAEMSKAVTKPDAAKAQKPKSVTVKPTAETETPPMPKARVEAPAPRVEAPRRETRPEPDSAKTENVRKKRKGGVLIEDEPRLPELGGKLAGLALDGNGIPAALVAALARRKESASVEQKTLAVSLYWGDQLLQVAHFEKPGAVSIGEAPQNDFVIASDGIAGQFTFIQNDGNTATVFIPDAFATMVRRGKDTLGRAALKLKSSGGAAPYALSVGETLFVNLGALTLVVQYVLPVRRIATPLAERLDQAFIGTSVFVTVFTIFFCLMVAVSPKTDEAAQDDLFKNQARFAKLLLTEQKKTPKKFELSGQKLGGKHKDDDGRFNKKDKTKDALASAKGAPRVDPNKREKDRQIALNSGLLAALKGGKNSAVSSVFGPGGLGTGINTALGGLHGNAMGDAGGAGGLGSRGTGPGNGGNSLGIGGIGNGKGNGGSGVGNVDLGGRGKNEHAVEHSKTSVQGGLSQEAIGRVLDRAKSQMRYCYEKELQRLPDLYGKVTVKFEINGTGSVGDTSVVLTTLNNTNVEECLLRVYRRLRFPQPVGGGVVTVNYPMVFNKSGSE